MSELISIITPSYNSEKYIVNTIDSVLNQTYQNWELIIVDDCSPDNANQIIESYCHIDARIKLIKLPENNGVAYTRNVGIRNSVGSFICFLDSDDIWESCKLEKQIRYMHNNYCGFTYTSYKRIDENGRDLKTDSKCQRNSTL